MSDALILGHRAPSRDTEVNGFFCFVLFFSLIQDRGLLCHDSGILRVALPFQKSLSSQSAQGCYIKHYRQKAPGTLQETQHH